MNAEPGRSNSSALASAPIATSPNWESERQKRGATISFSLLDDLLAYFYDRMDADGVPSGGGYRPNEEMMLYTRLEHEAGQRTNPADRRIDRK